MKNINLFTSPPPQILDEEFPHDQIINLAITSRYSVSCICTTMKNINNYLDQDSFLPFVSYSFYSTAHCYFMCIVSVKRCYLFVSSSDDIYHFSQIVDKMVHSELLPCEDCDEEKLKLFQVDQFEFLKKTHLKLIRNCSKSFLAFANSKSQIHFKTNDEIEKEKVFTFGSYLSISIKPIICFYFQSYFYPTVSFIWQSYIYNELEYENNSSEITDNKILGKRDERSEQTRLIKFQLKEFLRFDIINRSDKSDIFLGYHIKSEKLVALKIFRNSNHAYYYKEKDIYEKIRHYCILKCYGFIENQRMLIRTCCLVFPYMCNGSLSSNLSIFGNDVKTKTIIRILYGIDYLHSIGIMHRDIKPDNILLDSNYESYISDFDSCQSYLIEKRDENKYSSENNNNNENNNNKENSQEKKERVIYSGVGTKRYMAPENFVEQNCSFQSDLFSLGMLIYQLATGNAPFSECSECEVNERVLKGEAPDLSIEDYGSIARLYNICRSLKITGRTLSYYLIQIMKDSHLFFKNDEYESIFEYFDFLDFFRNDISPKRGDVCFLLESASKGDINSMFFYGKLLHKGCIFTNGREDNQKAFEIFTELAEKGYLESIYKVGRIKYKGYGEVKQDSFHYLKKAANQGHIKAMYYLSRCYLKGIGCKANIEKYFNWLITSAAMNCAKAKFRLAIEPLDSESIIVCDLSISSILLYQSAQMGNLWALGAFGYGCLQSCADEDLKITQYFASMANDKKNSLLSMGSTMLSSCKVLHKRKQLTKKDKINFQKQSEYEKKANFYNDPKSQFKIGIIYLTKDFTKAMNYFAMSAKNQYPDAMHVIAAFNEWHNLDLSISQYITAASKGSKKSMVRLAQIYFKRGINIEEAIHYLMCSILGKSKKGYKEYGYLYYKGIYVPKNKKIACECFIHSDKHTVSQYYLAKMYEKGIVLPQNKDKAIHYYRLAATDIFRPKAALKLSELTNGEEKVKNSSPKICLSRDTTDKYKAKHLYHCYTCGIVVYVICSYCAKYCHKGHDIVDVGIREMRCCCQGFGGCK